MIRPLSRIVVATLGLAAATSVHAEDTVVRAEDTVAEDPAPQVSTPRVSTPRVKADAKAASQYRTGRTLGTTGMALGYAGPVVVGIGGVMLVGGLINAVEDDTSEGTATALGGAVVGAVGWSAAIVGPTLLASGSLLGASGVRNAGGSASGAAGWVAVGGSAIQIGSLVGRAQSGDGAASGGMFALGIAGWGTAMIAGTIQHVQNRSGWESIEFAQAPPRFQIALVPTGKGAALIGTF
jgi:hypothetical protein